MFWLLENSHSFLIYITLSLFHSISPLVLYDILICHDKVRCRRHIYQTAGFLESIDSNQIQSSPEELCHFWHTSHTHTTQKWLSPVSTTLTLEKDDILPNQTTMHFIYIQSLASGKTKHWFSTFGACVWFYVLLEFFASFLCVRYKYKNIHILSVYSGKLNCTRTEHGHGAIQTQNAPPHFDTPLNV